MNSGYKKIVETSNKERKKYYWNIGIGLQDVDKLRPSNYLIDLSQKNINGEISYEDIELALNKYYELTADKDLENKEADFSATRIAEFLEIGGFKFAPIQLKAIHKFLFQDVFDHAGKFREYNIMKEEAILNNKSVKYADFRMLDETLYYDFEEEKDFSYDNLSTEKMIKHISRFISNVWQIHPFYEGNTRTIAVFTIQYLEQKGIEVTNDMFKEHSKYFRDALVRANYSDIKNNISEELTTLNRFFDNLINNGKHKLESKDLINVELFKEKSLLEKAATTSKEKDIER